jgi:hypothetical protein
MARLKPGEGYRERRERRKRSRRRQARKQDRMKLAGEGAARLDDAMANLEPVMKRGKPRPLHVEKPCDCQRPDGTRPNHGPHFVEHAPQKIVDRLRELVTPEAA